MDKKSTIPEHEYTPSESGFGLLFSIGAWRRFFEKFGTCCAAVMLTSLIIGFGWNQFGAGRQSMSGGESSATKVALKVNGQPVTVQQVNQAESQAANNADASSEQSVAMARGQAMSTLIVTSILEQLAKQDHVTVAAAQIDKAIADEKTQLGVKSDADWNKFLGTAGITNAQLRQQIASNPKMLALALQTYYESKQNISDTDVNNQNVQVNLDTVFIPYGKQAFNPSTVKTLTQAEAQSKINALYTEVKSGKNIAAIALANTLQASYTPKNGVTGFRPEYTTQPSPMGALSFGPAFDSAVHSTKVGDLTPVVQSAGFYKGYIFAKVLARKTVLPKGWNATKTKAEMISSQAQQQLSDAVTSALQHARIQIVDKNLQPYYDLFLLGELQQQQSQSMEGTGTAPSPTAMKAEQAKMYADFATLLKNEPNNATAAYMVSQDIQQNKLTAAGVTPAQRAAYNQQLIKLYNIILESTEDRGIRFQLADLYKDEHDNKDALSQYQTIAKFMQQSPPGSPQIDQQYITYYQRLADDFTSLGDQKDAALMQKLVTQTRKQYAIDQKAAASAPPQGMPGSPTGMPPSP